MIRFESNMLVLDPSVSKEDADAINAFIEHIKEELRGELENASP